jgi:hypothetical protein
MIEQSLLQMSENWGYYLLPKPHPCSPGYSGLVVGIRGQPTHRHYDPEWLLLRLRDQTDHNWTTLKLSPPIASERQVMVGRVTLGDRNNKRIEFYTFGATLETSYDLHWAVYVLRSLAPVLKITGSAHDVADQLATATDELIGRWQAKVGLKGESVIALLGRLSPEQLYLLCLQSLLQRYERLSALGDSYLRTYHMLVNEQQWFTARGQWQPVVGIGELFSQN